MRGWNGDLLSFWQPLRAEMVCLPRVYCLSVSVWQNSVITMIKSFRDKETEAIFNGEPVLKFQTIANVWRAGSLGRFIKHAHCAICRSCRVISLRR